MLLFKRKPKAHPSDLRLRRDLMDISLNRTQIITTRVSFPNGIVGANIRHFQVLINPEEGIYKGGKFLFEFQCPTNYPFAPPIVRCLTKLFHPNICIKDGQVHLKVLKEDWKPVLTINTLIFGLQLLFVETDFDSFCEEWKNVLPSFPSNSDKNQCCTNLVKQTLQGGYFFGSNWDSNLSLNNENDKNSSTSSRKRGRGGGDGDRKRNRSDENEEHFGTFTGNSSRRHTKQKIQHDEELSQLSKQLTNNMSISPSATSPFLPPPPPSNHNKPPLPPSAMKHYMNNNIPDMKVPLGNSEITLSFGSTRTGLKRPLPLNPTIQSRRPGITPLDDNTLSCTFTAHTSTPRPPSSLTRNHQQSHHHTHSMTNLHYTTRVSPRNSLPHEYLSEPMDRSDSGDLSMTGGTSANSSLGNVLNHDESMDVSMS